MNFISSSLIYRMECKNCKIVSSFEVKDAPSVYDVNKWLCPLCGESRNSLKTKENKMKKLYCIEVTREMEEKSILHEWFDHEPTKDEILDFLEAEDFDRDDILNYGKYDYYAVT